MRQVSCMDRQPWSEDLNSRIQELWGGLETTPTLASLEGDRGGNVKQFWTETNQKKERLTPCGHKTGRNWIISSMSDDTL